MNIAFTDEKIHGGLTRSYIGEGIKKYLCIMNSLHDVDVSKDKDFQKLYNHFYRVRSRDKAWYGEYYSFMETNKKNASLTFGGIARRLCDRCGRIEVSFSSKMLATINPDMPIWDKYVTGNIGLSLPPGGDKDRRPEEAIARYAELAAWYGGYLKSDNGRRMTALFDEAYPGAAVTGIKKIDFVLWQMRDTNRQYVREE
jgi:hypothetical protein